jgi:cell fate (sporulation/competence/biofilm development) regulator YmcA (YheA/YmcA/DUF963 family)
MIENDNQLQVAYNKIKSLEKSLEEIPLEPPFDRTSQMQIKALIEEIKSEIKEYLAKA